LFKDISIPSFIDVEGLLTFWTDNFVHYWNFLGIN
jgi:hypothetical protein